MYLKQFKGSAEIKKPPELLEENICILRVWRLVKDQVIISPAGHVIGVELKAVLESAKIIDYEEDKEDLVLKIQQIKDILYNKDK